MNKLTVKQILNLNTKELEKIMTNEEYERMQDLKLETWQLLEALQDSAKLSGQKENEEHTSITEYLEYLENMKG